MACEVVEDSGGDLVGLEEPLTEEGGFKHVAGARAAGNAHGMVSLGNESASECGASRVQSLLFEFFDHTTPRLESVQTRVAPAVGVHPALGRQNHLLLQSVSLAARVVVEVVTGRDLHSVGVFGQLHQRVVHHHWDRLVRERVECLA